MAIVGARRHSQVDLRAPDIRPCHADMTISLRKENSMSTRPKCVSVTQSLIRINNKPGVAGRECRSGTTNRYIPSNVFAQRYSAEGRDSCGATRIVLTSGQLVGSGRGKIFGSDQKSCPSTLPMACCDAATTFRTCEKFPCLGRAAGCLLLLRQLPVVPSGRRQLSWRHDIL